jgi:hypothetical protein
MLEDAAKGAEQPVRVQRGQSAAAGAKTIAREKGSELNPGGSLWLVRYRTMHSDKSERKILRSCC